MDDIRCFLCGDPFQDIKKLKFHLVCFLLHILLLPGINIIDIQVLVHPKSHVCLFCLEKKGWSDEFSTQVSQTNFTKSLEMNHQVVYNEHYTRCHSGVIEVRAEERQRARLEQKQKLAERRRQVELLNSVNWGYH